MNIPHLRQFLALSVIGSVTLMPLLVLPAMIGVLVDNAQMTDSSAGWSASAHFLANALVGLALSLRVHHLDLRRTATLALAVAVLADIVSALTAGPTVLFFGARILAGVALGAAYVATITAFPRYDGYDRGFGLFVTLQFIISGIGLYIVPVYADQMGATGLFLGLAVLDGIALWLARTLPTVDASVTESTDKASEWKTLIALSALLAIVGFATFEAANNAQFTYIERFGISLGISDEQVGFALLIASLIGIPGAFCIVFFGQRFGTLGPLVFGMGIAVTGLIILMNAEGFAAYFAGGCCMGFSWAFCLPYIQAVLANIDRKGSVLAAGSAFSGFGIAAGPGLAALVVAEEHYTNVFKLSIALFALTLAAFFYAQRNRRST